MRFEEFGLKTLPGGACADCDPLPTPASCAAHTPQASLDAFLNQPLNPLPTKQANTSLPNPWQPEIEQCIRPMAQTAIEGRPPGGAYAHQRWDEFLPGQYFQSAARGARQNGGLRDGMRLHGWATGEFAPGGLYYAYAPGLEATNKGTDVRLHPKMPIQNPDVMWTFDGTLPPKLLMSRYGFPTLFRHYNGLPIDPAANYGFGVHTLTTHEHNGHNPAESDGYMSAFFFPGQYFDYRWPMILAGHDHTNIGATDPRAATPDGAGGTIQIPGDWRETMSTHWFHDHMFDYTAQNLYKGSAAMNIFYSAVDRGNEVIDCPYAGTDTSMNPAHYEPGGRKMIPNPSFSAQELAGARHRSFEFDSGGATDNAPWTIRVDDELEGDTADPHIVSAAPDENSVEIWHLKTGGGWSHPVHIHFEEGQILTRDGEQPPLWEQLARKDVYRIGSEVDSSREVSIALRFREFSAATWSIAITLSTRARPY